MKDKTKALRVIRNQIRNYPLRFNNSNNETQISVTEIRKILYELSERLVNEPFPFAYVQTGNVMVIGFKIGPNEKKDYDYQFIVTQDYKSFNLSDQNTITEDDIKVENDAKEFFRV